MLKYYFENRIRIGRRIAKGILGTILIISILGGALFMNPIEVQAYDEVVIVIDPGHGGGGDDDSQKGASYNDLNEKDIDLITARALYDELSQYGNLKVYMTRTEDKAMSLQERVDYAASVNADMLIAVHYNASAHHRFYGSEIFTSAFGEEYAAGYSLAQNIMNWWVEDGSVSKGIKTRIGSKGTDYYGLIRIGREKSIPTIILEHGYLDNDTDFSKLKDASAWQRMGVLDATAIADYYGVKKNMVSANVNREYTVAVPTSRVEPDTTEPTDVSVTIDAYDYETGMLTYTVTASDSDGKLMYFDLDTEALSKDEEKGFMNLNVWKDGSSSMQGAYKVPEGYGGSFVARVYNAYELYTDSAPVKIPDELIPANISLGGTAEGVIGDDSTPSQNQTDGADSSDISIKDGDWNLTDALNNTGGSEYSFDDSSLKKKSRSNYIGMVSAIVIAILMLVASIVMAVKTALDKKNKRKRGDNYGKRKDHDYF